MMVLVFNDALVRYISRVLPALGVDDVPVTTYERWASKLRQRTVPHLPKRYAEDTPSVVTRLKKHPAMLRLIDGWGDAEAARVEAAITDAGKTLEGSAPALRRWRSSEGEAPGHRLRRLLGWLGASEGKKLPAATRLALQRTAERAEERSGDVVEAGARSSRASPGSRRPSPRTRRKPSARVSSSGRMPGAPGAFPCSRPGAKRRSNGSPMAKRGALRRPKAWTGRMSASCRPWTGRTTRSCYGSISACGASSRIARRRTSSPTSTSSWTRRRTSAPSSLPWCSTRPRSNGASRSPETRHRSSTWTMASATGRACSGTSASTTCRSSRSGSATDRPSRSWTSPTRFSAP